ncbi:MAG: ABC transporter permease, partial [Saprospiraceae bacterium]
MRVLWATIYKDWLILIRDRVGLSLMFGMPILLAILITSVQNSAFELVNDNKVHVVICNQDTGSTAKLLVDDLQKVGMFHVEQLPGIYNLTMFKENFFKKDALVGLLIPKGFSAQLDARIWEISSQALGDFGLGIGKQKESIRGDSLIMYYHPVLQQSYQESIRSAVMGVLQLVENKKLIGHLYRSINDKEMPAEFEDLMLHNQPQIKSIPILR